MTSRISEYLQRFCPFAHSCVFFLFFDDTPANSGDSKRDLKSQREGDEGNDGECINPADVEHGSLIDINGTLFVVKIRPVFHTDRGA